MDVDKSKSVLVDLSKLKNIVKNGSSQKIVYKKLVPKVDAIDTSGFVWKSKCDTDESSLKKKVIDAVKKYLILADLLKKQTIT